MENHADFIGVGAARWAPTKGFGVFLPNDEDENALSCDFNSLTFPQLVFILAASSLHLATICACNREEMTLTER